VNNLASKIMLALFPPNARFFKLQLSDAVKAALQARRVDVAQVEASLAKVEGTIVSRLEQTSLRSIASQLAKHLLVTGNYLLYIGKDLEFRGYGLRSFVVNRDPEGNVLEVVVKEQVSPETLSQTVTSVCRVDTKGKEQSPDKTVDLYTHMWRDGNVYRVQQEINGIVVPDTHATYPLDAPAFIPLRWTHVHGEDYGRGHCNEYIGDLLSLDDLSRDLLKASALAAKVLFLRNPNSFTTAKKFTTAKSGDFLDGKEGDVTTVSLEKYADFRVSLERISALEQSLSAAFLMNSSVQRNAERVTAEEIRFMAQDLEDALGGVYSVLAQELQLTLLRRILNVLSKKGELPSLPKKDVKFTITTGLEALGRGHDLNKVVQFVRTVREVLGEEGVALRLKPQWVIGQIATAMGIDQSEAVATDEEVQQIQQQQAMRQMVEKLGPGVAQELTKGSINQNG
jgi:hypothetical protein